jgi:signal transduction histidine kinase
VKVEGRFKEIEKLGAAFNTMLDCIQTLLKSMKEINDNIAHDLRSPLARIRGFAEMTLLGDKSINDYRDMAVNTIEECDTMIDMINTMLDITEAEAGVKEVKKEHIDLVSLISDACDLFRPIADDKEIDLKALLPEVLNWKSDRKKLQRIVTNMLENAIKYTPEKGAVTISASARNGEVRIDVQDTGMGISERDLPHIFERFYRCDRSRSCGGVGLGLSLVKAYTESLNGTIHVESILNQGSIFSLRFPK